MGVQKDAEGRRGVRIARCGEATLSVHGPVDNGTAPTTLDFGHLIV